jgi:hypothetical protein
MASVGCICRSCFPEPHTIYYMALLSAQHSPLPTDLPHFHYDPNVITELSTFWWIKKLLILRMRLQFSILQRWKDIFSWEGLTEHWCYCIHLIAASHQLCYTVFSPFVVKRGASWPRWKVCFSCFLTFTKSTTKALWTVEQSTQGQFMMKWHSKHSKD